MKVRIKNRKTFNYLFIIIFGIILGIPLFSKDLNIYYNQGFYSIGKGFEFTKNFAVNQGKILTSFFNYLGTGDTILEAPLGTMLIFIGNYIFGSYIFTYKIIVFCSILLSGLYMHKYCDKVTQNKNVALLSTLLYMSAPIHLGQIYVNNYIDSILVFVFIPMIFLGLYKLFNTTENCYQLSFGIVGLVLTDLKLAVVVGISVLIYFLINFKSWQVEHVRKYFVINFIAVISITAFFVFPYIQANLATKYVGSNSVKEVFLDSRVKIKSLFVTEENDTNILQFGWPIMMMLALSIMSLRKQKESEKKEFAFCLAMVIFYVVMATKIFPWWIFPNWISKLENAYIFLIVGVFFECVVCAMNMNAVLKSFRISDVIIIAFISLIYILTLKVFIPYENSVMEIDKYDVSEIIEYSVLPKKAKENIEYIRNRSKDVEILNGTAEILEKNKFLTYYSFRANTLEKDTVYELPYIYYPGYEVRYDGINIDYFESDNGMIAIKMAPEEGTYFEVNYIGTDLMNFCKILSFVGLVGFSIYVYKKH